MRFVIPLLLISLIACEESTQNQGTTTTSARVQRRAPPPSPPPVMGQMPNSYTPPPTLPEDSVSIPESQNPPPGTSVVQTVPESRDKRITARLHQAIQDDDTLSPEAKHVEVITKNRKVTLKGRVHTEKERMDIDSKARAADDVIEVDNQIELIAPR